MSGTLSTARRRWYQFSLRMLLAVITLVAVLCGLLGNRMARAKRQAQAVAQLKEIGAIVYYDYERSSTDFDLNKDVSLWRDSLQQPGSVWLRHWLGVDFFAKVVQVEFTDFLVEDPNRDNTAALRDLPDIEEVHIGLLQEVVNLDTLLDDLGRLPKLRTLTIQYRSPYTHYALLDLLYSRARRPVFLDLSEEGQKSLGRLTSLERLSLFCVFIGDDGVHQLGKLPNVKYLELVMCGVGDDDLKFLGEMPQLRKLQLISRKVTDVGLARLNKLQQLEKLDLSFSRTTDAGLSPLKSLSQLRHLTLINTDVSDAGIEHLARLPSLESVNIWDTKVTEKGAANLQQRRPSLKVQLTAPQPTAPFPGRRKSGLESLFQ